MTDLMKPRCRASSVFSCRVRGSACVTGAPVAELSVPVGRLAVVLAVVGVSVVGPAVGPEMIIFLLVFGTCRVLCNVLLHDSCSILCLLQGICPKGVCVHI